MWNIFVTAPMENRIARIMEREGLDEKAASNKICKTDKKREYKIEFEN